jgi:hypothetical protein
MFICALALLALAPAAHAQPRFYAGAGRADITPPKFDAADDARDFAIPCPTALFSGPRLWRFEEPYTDVDDNGRFDYPEPYCDANANGRWDGMFSSGGIDARPKTVHDPIDVRAVAVGDGARTVVIASVVSQGMFENYIARARDELAARGVKADLLVSSNHNESSPDSVGIYGSPDVGGIAGARSSIDDYYMHWVATRIAGAAQAAVQSMRPATLWARKLRAPTLQRAGFASSRFPLLADLDEDLSKQFPTTDDAGKAAAIEAKLGILQARDADGVPIFTLLNLSAHNQRVGHDTDATAISSDWPGAFARHLEQSTPGMAVFLAGLIGSQEDPDPVPGINDAFARAEATGARLADAVAAAVPDAHRVRPGAVSFQRKTLYVPLENNAFKAIAASGMFGERQLYTAGLPAGPAGQDVRTSVALATLGPDLQVIANPAESFPALELGSPWTIDDAECPSRANPPVPNWISPARWRFNAGLADDLIGYIGPSWAFAPDTPGTYTAADCPQQQGKHAHKLETESVGPSAGNIVAQALADLIAAHPDPIARVRSGRFIQDDGRLTAQPDEHTVGAWVADAGSTQLAPGKGTVLALRGVEGFHVDERGRPMDYDGRAQSVADVLTRGFVVRRDGRVAERWYVRVYERQGVARVG